MKQLMPVFVLLVVLGVGGVLVVAPAGAAECIYYSDTAGYVCDARLAQPSFETPDPLERSLPEHSAYAWVADFANVYPHPGASNPAYNMGEGFLYVTLYDVEKVNGETWYEINPGEFIRGDDIHPVNISEFRGVEVNEQPTRPFGWIVREVQPSTVPNGAPDEAFAPLERYTFFQIYDAAVGEEGWIWYEIGRGRWIRQTYVSIVDPSPRPGSVAPHEFWVEIDLYEQTFAAYEGDRMVYAGLVSSGLNRWPTREGLFQVWSHHYYTPMSGAQGKVDYYFLEDVPHTMFFDEDIALHGAYWHDRFGYKHSHGCVNMPPYDAEWVYYWSAQAPNDLWVWVHTSDPASYFTKYDA